MISNSTSEYASKRNEGKKFLPYVHIALFTVTKLSETTEMSFDGWMNKPYVVCTCTQTRILLGSKKEGNNDKCCYNMDETYGHYVWNEISQSQKGK